MNILSQAIKRFAKTKAGCLSKEDYRARFQMTLSDWILHHQKDIIFDQCSWMGIRTLKNPLDMWIYQEIIFQVKPDVIIEIGSYEGGATLYLAHLLDLMGQGTVISIDIDRSKYKAKHNRIIDLTGDSASNEIVSEVTRLCEGKKVLVLHDGDHSKAQVLKDLAAYSKLVSMDSYFIVEDGIVDIYEPGDGMGLPEDGPLAAVEEFIEENSNFTIDAERERYILTYSPKGFLRRVK